MREFCAHGACLEPRRRPLARYCEAHTRIFAALKRGNVRRYRKLRMILGEPAP